MMLQHRTNGMHSRCNRNQASQVRCNNVIARVAVMTPPRSKQTTTASRKAKASKNKKDLEVLERQVLECLAFAKGRGKEGLDEEQQAKLNEAIQILEADGGVADPTADAELDGTWKLLYTSRPGTASPIQRTFTGVDWFSIFQEVSIFAEEARVNNVVEFGDWGCLRVEAQASTEERPLEGFTPRQDKGDFLFGLFGRSTSQPAAKDNIRIDFQFDRAAFEFSFLPFKIPYPVPFRLLGDERKGWIDVTYLSQDKTFRLSRGNKGTLFILSRGIPLKQQLKRAITELDNDKVLSLISLMANESPVKQPAKSPKAAGTWRLVWSHQAETASPLQKFGSKQANSFQIIDGEEGTLQNLVDLGFVRISAKAECDAASDTRTNVTVTETSITLGKALRIPLPRPKVGDGNPGWVEWLYLDDDVRITKGSKGSLFIHYRDTEDAWQQ